tara:strand:- start:1385 stop:2338 length:954 start_codon:yes stop_codon:yes gene_type:complete
VVINKSSKIYVAGHNGMVGSAILRKLKSDGFINLIYINRDELDLMVQNDVESFFKNHKPEYVFICAAKVGGIYANNTYGGEFLYNNLQIQNNLIHFASKYNVTKLLFLGSSCIYPRNCIQPIDEEALLTGPLEKTNEPYAIAKIAGIKMCEYYHKQYGSQFFSIMPTNLYGPNDNYDLNNSHVLPAIIRKIYEAIEHKQDQVTLWGTGNPLREFMHVDDLASAAVFIMKLNFDELYNDGLIHLNVGTEKEISINDLSEIISRKMLYEGKINFDISRPDGTPRKIMNSTKLYNLGWSPSISLERGIETTIEDFKQNLN